MQLAFLLLALAARANAADPKDFSRCNQPGGPIGAEGSPSQDYFRDLLARGTSAPFESFLHLWYPGRKGDLDPAGEAKLEACARSGCPLDTVYSWGSKAKLLTLEKTMPDGASWSGSPNPGYLLDTLFSAVATHAYGNIPVRIKVIPGATVFPNHEQQITDGNQVESWSFGTPEQYDEIVRDIFRSRSGKPWHGYWALEGLKTDPTFKQTGDPLFPYWPAFNHPANMDGHDFTELELKTSLLDMIRMILNGEGHIYYSKGTCRNREQAFETLFPTYIDPFLLKAGTQPESAPTTEEVPEEKVEPGAAPAL